MIFHTVADFMFWARAKYSFHDLCTRMHVGLLVAQDDVHTNMYV